MDRTKHKRIRYDTRTKKMLENDEKIDENHGSTSVANDVYDDYSSASSTCSEDEVYD